jgi:hypothetical protein
VGSGAGKVRSFFFSYLARFLCGDGRGMASCGGGDAGRAEDEESAKSTRFSFMFPPLVLRFTVRCAWIPPGAASSCARATASSPLRWSKERRELVLSSPSPLPLPFPGFHSLPSSHRARSAFRSFSSLISVNILLMHIPLVSRSKTPFSPGAHYVRVPPSPSFIPLPLSSLPYLDLTQRQ